MFLFRLSRFLDAWITEHPVFTLDRAAMWSLCLSPLVLAILVLAVWRPGAKWGRPRRLVFVAAIAGTILLARLPLLCRDYLNPDEAVMLAGGMGLVHDPVPYRSSDALTDGPLDSYVLTWPALAGQPLTYVSSRLTAIAEISGIVLFLWFTCRLVMAEWIAGLAVMPVLCFFVFAVESDFVHNSSEHLPVFLSAAAMYLLAHAWRSETPVPRWRWALAGVLAGAMPFGKLQALPVTGMLLLIGAAAAWRKPARWPALFLLAAGAVSIPLILLVAIAAGGSWQEFWRSYILNSIYYTGHGRASGWSRLLYAKDLVFSASSFGAFAAGTMLVSLAGTMSCVAVVTRRQRPGGLLFLTVASAGLVVGALAAIVTPGRQFPHYLLFLVFPAGLFTACAVAWTVTAAGEWPWKAASRRMAAVFFVLLTCVWPAVSRLQWSDAWDYPVFDPGTRLVQAIQRYCAPHDTLVVWGWRSELYVSSARAPGTRHMDSILEIDGSYDPEYFRTVYLEDFRRSRPAVFVDAVGPGDYYYTDPSVAGYETFPALRAEVDGNYDFVGPIDGARLWVRKR
jgi:hypothetical protein